MSVFTGLVHFRSPALNYAADEGFYSEARSRGEEPATRVSAAERV